MAAWPSEMRRKLTQTMTRLASMGGGIERSDTLAALVGLGLLATLVSLDMGTGELTVLTGTYLVVPLIVALWAGVAVTAALGALTLLAGISSGAWNSNFAETDYVIRIAVLGVSLVLAVAGSWARERARRGTRRLEILNAVGAIADGSLLLAQTLDRVLDVIVPTFADACMVDAIHERRVLRSAARVRGRSDARELERYLAAREPSLPEWMTRPEAPFPRHPRFIPRFDDEITRRLAHGPEDLEWMRSIGLSSSITVPLLSRGRMLGALTFFTAWSGRHYTPEDVRFAQTLAGRVALALDNAGLFSDLESVERRMDSVMSMLDEGVVIHDADGELVYSNPAAARLMGFEGPDEVGTRSSEQIRERFQVRAEDGSPLPQEMLAGRRALSGATPEPLVLRVTNVRDKAERWLITRAKPIMGPDDRVLYSVTAIEDVTGVKRAEFAQRLLGRTGELLATSTDYQGMLRGLADLAVPEFADWCSVNIPGEGGVVEQVALSHADPEHKELAHEGRRRFRLELGRSGGVATVLRTGEAQLVTAGEAVLAGLGIDPELQEGMEPIGLRSGILAPMTSGRGTVGVLAFGNGGESREFDEDDLALAVEIARRAGTAVENARLAEERAEVARILQEGLLPRALPHMSGWETAAVYQPAGEVNAVGGDFYDAFEIEGGWMLCVGDVVGRGAAAASLTALARHTIRTAGTLTADPCRALSLLDEALRARGETALCTAAILVLPRSDADPVDASLVCAGHPLPLLLRDGEVSEVGRPGPLLGAFTESEWHPTPVRLQLDDQLVVFTDGVIEARGATERFGEERLHAELVGVARPMQAIARVTAALEAFLGGEPDDDVAMIAVRRAPASPVGDGSGSKDGRRIVQEPVPGSESPPAERV